MTAAATICSTISQRADSFQQQPIEPIEPIARPHVTPSNKDTCRHSSTSRITQRQLIPAIANFVRNFGTTRPMSPVSVILHCDLDCFYAQVERERLGMPHDAAIAVVQWASALAVSYPARVYGLKRGHTVDQIRAAAGDAVTIVHVETISASWQAEPASVTHASEKIVRDTQKVSLARYRSASAAVFSAITDAVASMNAVVIERASIDEAYIDVTAEVDTRVQRSRTSDRTPDGLTDEAAGGLAAPEGTVVVGDILDVHNESDLRLIHGAHIASHIREHVLHRCKYTMSAGVSVNKLLSKFASAKNKPNRQTIVPRAAVAGLMEDVPLTKLRGLGGKLGHRVEELGVSTAAQASALSIETLTKGLGSRKAADFVYRSVRGIDDSPITPRELSKSLLVAKSFAVQHSLAVVEKKWLPVLANELCNRLQEDAELNNRFATTLSVSFRAMSKLGGQDMVSASRSVQMPPANVDDRGSAIMSVATNILRNVLLKEKQFLFPISFVGLTATNFTERAVGRSDISKFFQQNSAKSTVADDVGRNGGVSLDAGEVHKRRLQEKADRDLARRLHRQEHVKGAIKKPKKGFLPTTPNSTSSGKSSKSSVNGTARRIDSFFKASRPT